MPFMIISRTFKFDSAHKLPFYEGKCKNLHGHTFKLIVSLEGNIENKSGMIMDFNEVKKIVEQKVLSKLDHAYLNDIIENPTCENILMWIREQLKQEKKLKLKKLVLCETEDCSCEMEI